MVGSLWMFRITTSRSPSLSRSSKAAPRLASLTANPSPHWSETSTNFSRPVFISTMFRVR
jgi:hypothetical protein